jgi:hypothetical protein
MALPVVFIERLILDCRRPEAYRVQINTAPHDEFAAGSVGGTEAGPE